MNSYYSIQTGEQAYIRIPMISSLSQQSAIVLGALIASKNKKVAELMAERGDIMLGCMMGYLLDGENINFESNEAISLSKLLVSDVVNVLFETFAELDKVVNMSAEMENANDSENEPENSPDVGSDDSDLDSEADSELDE